jgi:hypothetical protein
MVVSWGGAAEICNCRIPRLQHHLFCLHGIIAYAFSSPFLISFSLCNL